MLSPRACLAPFFGQANHPKEVQSVKFKEIAERFDSLQREMDKRFSRLQWTMMLGLTMLGVLIGVMGYLGM